MVAAAIRTIFGQSGLDHVAGQPGTIATMPGRQFTKVETMLRSAETGITTPVPDQAPGPADRGGCPSYKEETVQVSALHAVALPAEPLQFHVNQ
jgi:hypothetical protein